MEISKKSELGEGQSKDFERNGKPCILVNVAGEYHAFLNICTHEECQTDFDGGSELHCPCHGSVFNAKDGTVINPPALEPLAQIRIKIEGDSILLDE